MASRRIRSSIGVLAHLIAALGALLLVTGVAQGATAAASSWERSPESAVRLISAVTATGGLRSLPLGLEFDMAPGWKTYWRSPGEGGFPPRLDWSGSQNVERAEIAWPAPERFSILGIDSVGYADAVVLPISLRVSESGKPARLRLAVDYLTCEQICIPQRADLAMDIPAGVAQPSPYAHLIDRYRGTIPAPPGPALRLESAEWISTKEGPTLRVAALSDRPFRTPDLFIEGMPSAAWGEPSYILGDDGHRAVIDVPWAGSGTGETDTELRLTFTLVDENQALEQEMRVAPAALAAIVDAAGTDPGLLAALAIALLGGLVLNLMPCVLPVLSIKVLGLVGHGGGDMGAARRSFLATAAGILASFVVLAAAAVAVRAAGVAVGWGMQFQQPAFLAAMTLVLVLFACNLWGLYEIPLPRWAAGASGPNKKGLSGPFFTGMLATVLATPCSAPFVGTAVAFALSRGAAEIFLIFAALGTGLALPYLAIAAYPCLATVLPRPGEWMLWLRRLLGVALIGTAVWLITVLDAQAPLVGAAVAASAVAMVAVLWGVRNAAPAFRSIAIPVLLVSGVASPFAIGPKLAESGATSDARWAPFNEALIEHFVEEGKVVFVDVTADWCITCQVNKAAVLDRAPVAERLFAGDRVLPMRADWTRPSDQIAAYLASFGRYGIPFNAVYGPAAPDGIALPELLTSGAVMRAMDEAAGVPERRVSAR